MKYHFPFYLQGQRDAPNQSKPHKPTLDLFHLNMTTIILQKIRSVSLLFSSDRGGGGYLKINALVFMIHAAITHHQHGAEGKHVC